MKSRRELRAERKRTQRRRLGGAGIALIVVVAIIVAAIVGFTVHQVTASNPPSNTPTQTTVLMQVKAADGTSTGGILMAHDRLSHNGVELLVPARLIIPACTSAGGQPYFSTLLSEPGGEHEAATTLTSALSGVPVDGTWTLTEPELTKLVDAVGGVTVDVDVDVTRPGPHGTTIVEIQKGSQHLNGTQAATFATYRDGPDEDASGQLARMQSVVQAAVDKLPRSPAAAEKVIASLGSDAGSTLGASRLSQFLIDMARDDASDGGVLATDIPWTKLDTGGVPSYQIDLPQTKQLAEQDFKDSLPKHPVSSVSVEVLNGVGTPGLVPSACSKLSQAGFTPIDGGNASSFTKRRSAIQVASRTVADAQLGQRVAAALHLPDSDVQVAPVPPTVAGVVVQLGGDYKP